MMNNSLSPAYYNGFDDDCNQYNCVAYDISACYWNILVNMKSLPISSPFDNINKYHDGVINSLIESNTLHLAWFMCYGLPIVFHIDRNNQWLTYELLRTFLIVLNTIWCLVVR